MENLKKILYFIASLFVFIALVLSLAKDQILRRDGEYEEGR